MKQFHLVVIYGVLGALLLARGQSADWFVESHAVAQTQTLEATSRLGPSHELELIDAKGENLHVRNVGGRISWSERPTGVALSVAVVQGSDVLKDLTAREEFADEREALKRESDAEYQRAAIEANAFIDRLKELDPKSPEYRQVYEEYEGVRKQYEEWRQAFIKRQDALRAAQASRAFQELIAAVDIVAARLEVDIVIQSTAPNAPVPQKDYPALAWDFASRQLLRYPEQIDITMEVREELALQAHE